MPYCRASTSAVSPMIIPHSEQVKPSRYIASTSVKLPILWPQRASSASIEVRHAAHRLDAAGDDDLATRRAGSTARPSATACIPDAHALLIVCAGTRVGQPGPADDLPRRDWDRTPPAGRGRSALRRRAPGRLRPRSSAARDGGRPELGRVDVPERPAVAPDRRPRGADNHDLRHRGHRPFNIASRSTPRASRHRSLDPSRNLKPIETMPQPQCQRIAIRPTIHPIGFKITDFGTNRRLTWLNA